MTIGNSRVKVRRNKKSLKTEIDVNLVVKLFGITFYSYTLKNRELWEEGQLINLSSEAQENKKTERLVVQKMANELHIKGSKFKGKISENAATTSYFTSDFLLRKLWINTHNGKPLNVDFEASGKETISTYTGERIAEKWVNSGDLDYAAEKTLHYSGRDGYVFAERMKRGFPRARITND